MKVKQKGKWVSQQENIAMITQFIKKSEIIEELSEK